MLKWIFLVLGIFLAYMIYTGNMGGARDATQNYVDIRNQKNTDESAAQGRPSPLHQLLEYKKQQQEGK